MLACAVLLLTLGERLANGDFEAPFTPNAIPSWAFEDGARRGGIAPVSRVEVDEVTKRSGRASLHLVVDDKARVWRAVRQEIEARPSATYKLTAFAKTQTVRAEKIAGTEYQQYPNAYVALFLRGSAGQIVAKKYAHATLPTADWESLTAEIVAPENTRSAEVYVFLSMSGEMWIDDVQVEIEGGKALPPMEVVLKDGFETATTLPAGWNEHVGASNAREGPRSKIEIDEQVGEPESPRSLHLSGDAATKLWFACARELEARSGDTFHLGASFKTLDVRKEETQFENLYLSLEFQTADGRVIASPIYLKGPTGTSDWKRLETKALAPEGCARVVLTAFLSMSGDVWIDRIELMRRGGGTPAYEDWMTMDATHVVVRYPKDHPQRTEMRAYAGKLDAAYEMVRQRLGASFTDKITVYIYAGEEQGRRFTGRALAFASPEDRTVHQMTSNTIAHEMVHVIALTMGYAQVPLFGEGIAVWLDGESDDSHHDGAARLLREGKLPSMTDLLERFRANEALSYPAAGSFVGYLLENYGVLDFKLVYVAADPLEAAPRIYKKTLAELGAAWREFLSKR